MSTRSAVLTSLPTRGFPQVDESTVCVGRSSSNIRWADIQRLRAEVARRSAPHLAVVPAPPAVPTRGPSRKARAHVPPYLQPGYWERDWKSPFAPLGERCHDQIRREMGREAAIRAVPKSLSALLKTAEWKGAKIAGTLPSPEIGKEQAELDRLNARLETLEGEIRSVSERLALSDLTPAVRESLGKHLAAARAAVLTVLKSRNEQRERVEKVRSEEWIRVVHPSGAELRIRPQWGE